jgi:hypothetical protein
MKAEDVEYRMKVSLERESVLLAKSPDEDALILPPNTASDNLDAYLVINSHTSVYTSYVTINNLIDACEQGESLPEAHGSFVFGELSAHRDPSLCLIALLRPASLSFLQFRMRKGQARTARMKLVRQKSKILENSRLTANNSTVKKNSLHIL